MNEVDLIERARLFEEEALAEIYDRYSPGIYRYAMRQLGDQSRAEDCVSETFSRFLAGLRNGSGPRQYLQAYLYRIAHNWITDCYRREPPPELPVDAELQRDHAADLGLQMHEIQECEQVRAALRLLTPEQRQVITLKFLEDWNHEEISIALKKPVGAVKALQHRGLAALKRLLLKNGDDR